MKGKARDRPRPPGSMPQGRVGIMALARTGPGGGMPSIADSAAYSVSSSRNSGAASRVATVLASMPSAPQLVSFGLGMKQRPAPHTQPQEAREA